jgi:hypothetical protein
LTTQKTNSALSKKSSHKWIWLLFVFFIATPAFSQDKPAKSPPKFFFKSKPKKAKVVKGSRDISGRKLRTKNKSSAARAVVRASSPYEGTGKRNRGDRASKPIRGLPPIRSSSARAARSNVFSNKGKYVNNPSSKPRDNQKSFSNRSKLARAARLGSSPPRFSKRGAGPPRSASGSFVSRGKKNVYWGKFSKGEKPITKDITGRSLRARNYRTPSPGVIPSGDVYRGRKRVGDRPAKGNFISRFSTASKPTERAWSGDVSGKPIRKNSSKKRIENPGQQFYPRKLSISADTRGRNKPLRGSGYQSRTKHSEKKPGLNPVPVKAPGKGASYIQKFIGNLKGRKPEKGGGSISGRRKNNADRPIPVRIPENADGRVGGFSGNLKARRPEKGGGSISGRSKSNGNRSIPVRIPENADGRVGTFSGSLKARRPDKGGGSISGKSKSNGNRPIPVRIPENADGRVGTFSGNLKARRPEKGGGSISGRSLNNNNRPIPVRVPENADGRVGTFSGNLKARKPEKGGGSISGKLINNNGKPMYVKPPLVTKGVNYSGKIKRDYGYFRNPNSAKEALKKTEPTDNLFAIGGMPVRKKLTYKYIQNPHAAKTSLKKKEPDDDVFAVEGLQVKRKIKYKFVQNPKANKNSLKKKEPDDDVFAVEGLQVKRKVKYKFVQNPKANKNSLKKREPDDKIAAVEEMYAKKKMTGKYVVNPSSKKGALMVLAAGQAYAKINNYQGNVKMKKFNIKDAHPDAKFAHGKANNVKSERTILTNVKLWWSKLFKKSDNQTEAVKEKVRRPRYDKKERELWKDLYD